MSFPTFDTISKATKPPNINSETYINSEKKNDYLSKNEVFLKEKALQALDLLRNNSQNNLNIQSGLFWKRGNLDKRFSGKKWKQRFYLLHEKYFHYFKPSPNLIKPYLGSIYLQNYSIQDHQDTRDHCFKLVSSLNERTYFISCDTKVQLEELKQEIIKQISLQIDQQQVQINGETKIVTKLWKEIKFEDLKFHEVISNKGSIKVTKGKIDQSETIYAIKSIPLKPELATNLNSILTHINTLCNLEVNPYLVKMIGFSQTTDSLYIIYSLLSHHTLSRLIFDHNREIGELNKMELCLSIIRGLDFLHSKDITHGSLKPESIFVESIRESIIYISAYGLSTLESNEELTGSSHPEYLAPEGNTLSKEGDIFSFAVIMYEIWTRKPAWGNKTPLEIAKCIKRGERPEIQKEIPFATLIKRGWHSDPSHRGSLANIYSEINKVRLKSLLVPADIHPERLRVQNNILYVFESQDTVSWKEFAKIFAFHMNKKPKSIKPLKYVLAQNGEVNLKSFIQFLRWYSPLDDGYENNKSGTKMNEINGWLWKDIEDIVSLPYFFGFLNLEDTQKLLNDQSKGSYLLRFSSEIGSYTLSVVVADKAIHHCRIEVKDKKYCLTSGSRFFTSLQELIEHFTNYYLSGALKSEEFAVKLVNPIKRN